MPRKDKLSEPRGATASGSYDSDAFARLAESIARFLGTGRYLAIQTIFVIVWIAVNAFLALQYGKKHAFDAYPFILLNLLFSTQAAYAAPLILLAQNRQTDRDKEEVERDRDTNARALAETEYLARELAELRIILAQKADRDDLVEPLERLTQAVENLSQRNLIDDEDDEDD